MTGYSKKNRENYPERVLLIKRKPAFEQLGTGEKAEFNCFPIFMEYFVKHARIYN